MLYYHDLSYEKPVQGTDRRQSAFLWPEINRISLIIIGYDEVYAMVVVWQPGLGTQKNLIKFFLLSHMLV